MKKIFSFLLLMCSLLGATPMKAATDYGFQMINVAITSDNYQKESEGKAWYYDPSANVLHLTKGTISTVVSSATMIKIHGDVNPSLKIQVDGECRISGTFSVGINFSGTGGQHVICGDGTLTMNSDRVNPQVIICSGSTSLTFKDLTVNITAYGDAGAGIVTTRFEEFVFDNCEMNIKGSYGAVVKVGSGKSFDVPVLKKCFITNGYYFSKGTAYDSTGMWVQELHIKRATCAVGVTIDEPVIGNKISSDLKPNSTDYYVYDMEWHYSQDGVHFYKLDLTDESEFQVGYYQVYVLLYPTEGHGFSSEKSDMTAEVNGKEAIVERGNQDYVLLIYEFPFLGNQYNLWLSDVQVNELNKDNIPVSGGKASYNPDKKMLTLSDVYIESGDNDYCIKSDIDGLTITLKGVNKLKSTNLGLLFPYIDQTSRNYTITGAGQLEIEALGGIGLAYSHLAIVNCGGVTITASTGIVSTMSLLYAMLNPDKVPSEDYETLNVVNSNVTVHGNVALTKLLLDENTVYMEEPEGGYFKFPTLYDASGNTSEILVIKKKSGLPGDVNEDGDVNINDVVAIINHMAGNATWPNADVNGDGKVDINDVVAVINIMATK